jgi:hypothetical protein
MRSHGVGDRCWKSNVQYWCWRGERRRWTGLRAYISDSRAKDSPPAAAVASLDWQNDRWLGLSFGQNLVLVFLLIVLANILCSFKCWDECWMTIRFLAYHQYWCKFWRISGEVR